LWHSSRAGSATPPWQGRRNGFLMLPTLLQLS
jgi:hypothetical protein